MLSSLTEFLSKISRQIILGPGNSAYNSLFLDAIIVAILTVECFNTLLDICFVMIRFCKGKTIFVHGFVFVGDLS
jgi:hypothetical protein